MRDENDRDREDEAPETPPDEPPPTPVEDPPPEADIPYVVIGADGRRRGWNRPFSGKEEQL